MTARRRDLRIPMTDAEYALAHERADAAGMKLAPWVRQLVLGDAVEPDGRAGRKVPRTADPTEP